MNIPMLVDPVGEHGLSGSFVSAKRETESDSEVCNAALLSPFASSEHAANGPLPSGAPKEYSSQTSTAAQGQADMLSARGTPSTFASTLAKAQRIGDLNAVSYPESVKAPNPVLDIAVMPGMFRCVSCTRFVTVVGLDLSLSYTWFHHASSCDPAGF